MRRRVAHLIILMSFIGTADAVDGAVIGLVTDKYTEAPVELVFGDVTYTGGGGGTLAVNDPSTGAYIAFLNTGINITVTASVPGYDDHAYGPFLPPEGIAHKLVRTSRMDSITWADDATELYEGEVLVGTLVLSELFPRADTVIDLSAAIGDTDQFELLDAGGAILADGTITVLAGELNVEFQLRAIAGSVDADDEVTLRASCAAIPQVAGSGPSGDVQSLDAPPITIRDARRTVRLSYGDEPGTVGRYTDLAAALAGAAVPTSEVETVSGEATFKGEDTAVPAGFHYEPTGGTKPTSN